MITYWKGDKAEYTGKVQKAYGETWHEIKMLEGIFKGQTKVVTDMFYQRDIRNPQQFIDWISQ